MLPCSHHFVFPVSTKMIQKCNYNIVLPHFCTADLSCLTWPRLWLMQTTVRSMLKQYNVLHYRDSSARKHMQMDKTPANFTAHHQSVSMRAPVRKLYANTHSWNEYGKVPEHQYEICCKISHTLPESIAEYVLLIWILCFIFLRGEENADDQWSRPNRRNW